MTLALVTLISVGGCAFLVWCFHAFRQMGRNESDLDSLNESLHQKEIEGKAYEDELRKIDDESIVVGYDTISASDASQLLSGKLKRLKNP